jgi:hypothetical protein
MPFKSQAQRRKFYAMAERGEISRKTVEEWEGETHGKLPERLHRKKLRLKKKRHKKLRLKRHR